MSWEPHKRLLTIGESAKSIGRPEQTIRRWVSEGKLAPTAFHGRKSLYLESDVLEAEAAARQARRNVSHKR